MPGGRYPSGNPACDLTGYLTCPVCMKRFIRPAQAVYKDSVDKKRYVMCSYNCLMRFRREHGKIK